MSVKTTNAEPRQTGPSQPRKLPRALGVRKAQQIANEHCLRSYAVAFVGGTPHRLTLPTADVWIVPVLFTSPGYGIVGDVGMIAVDALDGAIASATPRQEVLAAASLLAKEKRPALDAAFSRTRAT